MSIEDKTRKVFSKRLKKLRNDRGWGQKKLANKLNLSSKGTISAYENGRVPKGEMLNQIAEIFNVSVDYLLGRTDIKNPDIDIPEGVRDLLNEEENEFIIDLLNKDGMQLFLRESRGASDEDLATAVRVLKAVREGKEEGTEL